MKPGDRVGKIMVMKDGQEIKTGGEILSIDGDVARVRWDGPGGLKKQRILETVEWISRLTAKP
tara:strand:- start:235 stop:423 length:189 start_codon:yes stop_codon:yes gene_type:complete